MRRLVLALALAACSSSTGDMSTPTVDAPTTPTVDAPKFVIPADAQMADAAPATDVCGPAPTTGAQSCAMPGPGGTVPECTTTKLCTVSGCGEVTHDPDCVAECMRCSLCAVCNRQTHQWAVMPLDFCVPFGPCIDGGVGDDAGTAKR